MDKQIFETPPHRTGNIGTDAGRATLLRHPRAYRASFGFYGFKRSEQKIWHSICESANRLYRAAISFSCDFSRLNFAANPTKLSEPGPARAAEIGTHKEFLETEDNDGPTETFADHSFSRP